MEEITVQLDTIKEKLFEKQQMCEAQQNTINEQTKELNTLQTTITDLQKLVKDRDLEIKRIHVQLVQMDEKAKQEKNQLNCDIADAKNELNEAKTEIKDLKQYKTSYDRLESAFLIQQKELQFTKPVLPVIKPVIMSKKTQLINDIRQAVRLERQIEAVQNNEIEEFDQFLKEHTEQLVKLLQEGPLDGEYKDLLDRQIRSADEELLMMEERVKKCFDEMSDEMNYLEQHKSALVNELESLNDGRSVSWDVEKQDDAAENCNKETNLINDKSEADPFIPQENIFSRYATMIFSSNDNGHTFVECDSAKYCYSCGEKTVACPHKIYDCQLIAFKHPTTHIKIIRPKVRLNQSLLKQTVEIVKPPVNEISCETIKSLHNIHRTRKMEDYLPGNIIEILANHVEIERRVPRTISMEQVIEIIEQFAGYLLHNLSSGSFKIYSFQNNLHTFFIGRYLKENVAHTAYYDFLTSLPKYYSNKVLLVFLKAFIGELDSTAFWYILNISEIVAIVNWKEVQDFAAFAEVIYPFLNEDDIESLQMEYTSFSENVISRSFVVEYIVHLICKKLEPQFLEMEHKLIGQSNVKEIVYLSEEEFYSVTDTFLTLPEDQLRHQLYIQAAQEKINSQKMQGVSAQVLAQISSYLHLLEQMPSIRQTVLKHVDDRRNVRHNDPLLGGFSAAHVASDDFTLLSLPRIKKIADSISRRMAFHINKLS